MLVKGLHNKNFEKANGLNKIFRLNRKSNFLILKSHLSVNSSAFFLFTLALCMLSLLYSINIVSKAWTFYMDEFLR